MECNQIKFINIIYSNIHLLNSESFHFVKICHYIRMISIELLVDSYYSIIWIHISQNHRVCSYYGIFSYCDIT